MTKYSGSIGTSFHKKKKNTNFPILSTNFFKKVFKHLSIQTGNKLPSFDTCTTLENGEHFFFFYPFCDILSAWGSFPVSYVLNLRELLPLTLAFHWI